MLKNFFLILALGLVTPLFAQELPPPGEEIVPVVDEEAPAVDPNADPSNAAASTTPSLEQLTADQEENQDFTHTVKFDFVTRVSFTRMNKKASDLAVSDPPYMEIEYQTQWEKDVNLSKGKSNLNVDATYSEDHWGNLVENEFFSCRLEINIEKMPFKGSISIKTEKDEDDNETYKLLGNIDIARDDFKEDWFSFCTQGPYELNTKGDTEDYNYQVLKLINPSLSSITVDNYDPTESSRIDLLVEPTAVDDYDIDSIITYSGSGTLTVEPY